LNGTVARDFLADKFAQSRSAEQTLVQFFTTTADEFPSWANDEGRFAKEMTDWIKANMGASAAARALDMNGPSYDFSGQSPINESHVSALNWLNKVSANLTTLQTDSGWDGFKPPATPECT
jgi:hypothetical protein